MSDPPWDGPATRRAARAQRLASGAANASVSTLAPLIEALWQSLRGHGLSKADTQLVLHVLTTKAETELHDEELSGT